MRKYRAWWTHPSDVVRRANRHFFCYVVKGPYFWKAKKALARSPPFPPPPLPLCPLSSLSFFLVYSFRERPQCHYLKRSLCVTSSNPFVLTQTAGRGALSRFGLPSLHSSCTFSQRCNDSPVLTTTSECYSDRAVLHLLPAARREPCQDRKALTGAGSSITHGSPSLLSKTHSSSVSAWLCMFLWFFF